MKKYFYAILQRIAIAHIKNRVVIVDLGTRSKLPPLTGAIPLAEGPLVLSMPTGIMFVLLTSEGVADGITATGTDLVLPRGVETGISSVLLG